MTPTLTLDDLTHAVAAELQVAGVPYQDAELRAYLDAVWGRAKLDPEPGYRARRYAGSVGLDVERPVT